MKFSSSHYLNAAAVASFLSIALASRADTVSFAIDSANSSLTISGAAFGLAYTQQSAGSLVDSFGGTLLADLTGGVLTFSGGSSIIALTNSHGPFNTAPNPIGSEAGNFGVQANGFVTGYGVANIKGSYKDIVLDLTSGTVQNGLAPTGQNINPTAGTLDYGIVLNATPFQASSSSIVGKGGLNVATGIATFDGTVLTLPVQFSSPTYANRNETYTGVIVADIVPAPEPSTLALAGLGAAGFAGWSFRRSRKGC